MAAARTWKLQMNLDDFNAAFAALADEAERGQFLSGMSRGMNAGSFRESTQAFKDGYEVGHAMRQSAENYRAGKKSVGGLGGNPDLLARKDNHVVNHEDIQKVNQVDNHEVNQDQSTWITQSLILNPLISNPEIGDPESPVVAEPISWFLDHWNKTLSPLGYGKSSATDKRKKALKARIKANPDFKNTFIKAVDYLSKDSWWVSKSTQFTISLLLDQADRAQELSEKTPSNGTEGGKVHHRTETDLDGIRQLRERDERRKNEPKKEEALDDEALQNMFS